MKDDQFGKTKEYDPASYWDTRAKVSCGNTYDAVCAYGLSNAENWAMERVQSATLKKYLPTLGPQSNILEVGCGVGRWVHVFTDLGARYTGVDVSDEMLKLARERIGGDSSFHKVTSGELPFENDSFDFVFAITVIHHNPYDQQEKIISEMVRVTKPNGLILIMEGLGDARTSYNMFPRTIESWTNLFEQQGTRIIRMRLQSWWIFRNYVMYLPLRVMRKLFGRPRIIKSPFDKVLSILSGCIDPYLVPLLPRRFASNVGMIFKKTSEIQGI